MTYNCAICKKTFKGIGNNAQPITDGKVCNSCNFEVIEERIRRMNLPHDI